MPSQIFTSVAVTPQRKGLQVVTSSDILASLASSAGVAPSAVTRAHGASAASLSCGSAVITTDLPQYAIREHDYTVPAPPPPSPVSFRNDHHWLPPSMVNKNSAAPVRH